MRRSVSLLCLLFLGGSVSGCDGFFLFVSTGPLPDQRISPTSPSPTTVIVVGDVVHSTFVVPQVCFDVRATSMRPLPWSSVRRLLAVPNRFTGRCDSPEPGK